MKTINTSDISRISDQHAEAALCHLAHVAGLTFDDEQFEDHKALLSLLISDHLARVVRLARGVDYVSALEEAVSKFRVAALEIIKRPT